MYRCNLQSYKFTEIKLDLRSLFKVFVVHTT